MTSELDNYRREIDALDDQIIALLKDRLNVVKRVGEFKRETAPDAYPIRPGREAQMVRRIAGAFEGSSFSPAAAAAIWRIIIGTSTALESKLSISVFAPDEQRDCFWLAREYFGPAATITRQPHVKRVIGDVLDGTAAVGVVPVFSSQDDGAWWTSLIQPSPTSPKIFAHLPFTLMSDRPKNSPSAVAFSKLAPEASGEEDMSLIALEVDQDVSQSRLQTALTTENFSANWINATTIAPGVRHHLLEIKGFVTPQDIGFKKFLTALGASVQQAHFLGAYAIPFTIKERA